MPTPGRLEISSAEVGHVPQVHTEKSGKLILVSESAETECVAFPRALLCLLFPKTIFIEMIVISKESPATKFRQGGSRVRKKT